MLESSGAGGARGEAYAWGVDVADVGAGGWPCGWLCGGFAAVCDGVHGGDDGCDVIHPYQEAEAFPSPFSEEGAREDFEAVPRHLHSEGYGVHPIVGISPGEAETVLVATSQAGAVAHGAPNDPFILARGERAPCASKGASAAAKRDGVVSCLEVYGEHPAAWAEEKSGSCHSAEVGGPVKNGVVVVAIIMDDPPRLVH